MNQRAFHLIFLLAAFLLTTACQATSTNSASRHGKILLWHGWNETDAATLNLILNRFNEIQPNLDVITQAVPAEDLRRQYVQTAGLGLGPDLFIGPGQWLRPLADEGLIQPINRFDPPTADLLSRSVESLRYMDELYGLPLSLRPFALYYNRSQVDQPATNLDEWLAQAADGQAVALNTNFLASFWGIQAFGGRVFDETGRVVLDEGGFANWLRWLQIAQNSPGMILSRDNDSLRQLFFSGNAAYYAGTPDDLAAAKAALGEGNVAVVPLPAGPVGPSGPLLDVEAIYFNPAATDRQTEMALQLAAFLTNASQSTTLLREIDRVPANRTVAVDPRLHPAAAGFAAQARTAVSVPNNPQFDTVVLLGNDLNRAVLEGVVDVTEAIAGLVNDVNELYGFAIVEAPPSTCTVAGVLFIAHPWSGPPAQAIQKAADDYEALCPEIEINISQLDEDRLFDLFAYGDLPEDGYILPHLIFGPNQWALPFSQAATIQPLGGLLLPEVQQRFHPNGLRTLEIGTDLFGLPYWLELDAFYVNNELISDPPATLNDLLLIATPNSQVALSTDFVSAYWGATAFGSRLFDDERRLALVETGFVDWLAWVDEAAANTAILFDADTAQLQEAFLAGELGLVVSPSSALGLVEQTIGEANVSVTSLPTSVGGEARPWLQTAAIYLTADLPATERDAAMAFATFITNADNQAYLAQTARLTPANINVNTEEMPRISGILRSASNAFVPPNIPELTAVLTYGNQAYQAVLVEGQTPLQAACALTVSVDSANGFSVEPADLPPPCRDLADFDTP